MSTLTAPPTGTVTFLFTDIEGSTTLWEQHPDAMRLALARHDALLRGCIEDKGGFVFKTIGNAFCAAFAAAGQALEAALGVQMTLSEEPWPTPTPVRVRMALHTGTAEERGGDYFGPAVNRVARLMATGHGGQVLLSGATQETVHSTLPASVTLLHLGRHRLKDLGRPEQVFQLQHPTLLSGFDPIRSLDSVRLPNNLPQQASDFIGREKEIAEVKALLGKTRLLTLTGAGGTGKTRLSLQVAADLLDGEGDGVWLVELAALSDPSLVPQAVADVLGVRGEAGTPILKTLTGWLRPKRLLIVLDNCEHLVAACAALASGLLESCPGVHILASSREPLGVAGEQVYRVPSLARPDPASARTAAAVSGYEAVALFSRRAQAVQPAFAVTDANASAVAQVCWRLDGLPLAIELAAARVRAMPVEQINTRLDDRFRLLTGGSRTALPRQQTLRALVDWSYDLLIEQEKALLRRLSVFAGGWTLEAAEAACPGEGVEGWEVLDLLTGLVDKSLVVYEPSDMGGRYRLLETVRGYTRERLAGRGEAEAVQGQAAAWFHQWAALAGPGSEGPEAAAWLARLEAEHDNLRASLAWLERQPAGAKAGVELSGELWHFWMVRGHITEGRQWLGRALARVQGGEDAEAQDAAALAFYAAGSLAMMQADYAVAEPMLRECLAIWRRQGKQQSVAAALSNLGVAAQRQNDYAAAQALFEEVLAIYRTAGNQMAVAGSLNNLGDIAKSRGDHAAAQALFEEGIALARPLGNQHLTAILLDNLGTVALRQGDPAAARSLLAESLTIKRQRGDQWGVAYSLEGMAGVEHEGGRPVKAATLLSAASLGRAALDAHLPAGDQAESDKRAEAVRAALSAAAFSAAWAEGQGMDWEQAARYALSEEKSMP